MTEKITQSERIPTRAEILEIFNYCINGESFTIRRELSDEHGPYLIEVTLNHKTSDGFSRELSFARKGSFEGNKSSKSAIHLTYFDPGGIPVGGTLMSELKNGQWTAV